LYSRYAIEFNDVAGVEASIHDVISLVTGFMVSVANSIALVPFSYRYHHELRQILKVVANQPSAVMIGPDTGYKGWQQWLRTYLPLAAAKGTLHAVTHHIYPGISRSSFNSPQALDAAHGEIVWYVNTIHSLAPGAQVWAGEDGPIGGGNSGTCGINSVCTTYASALWYADDLSNRAVHGFVQYQRQALVGGAYGLTASAVDHPQSALGPDEYGAQFSAEIYTRGYH
jgi:hypothetical protein